MFKTLAQRTCMTIAAMMLLGTFTMAAGDAWMVDYDAALEEAKQEGKDLLVDFSGSDWCGWCIKLDKEVFSHEAFQAEATNTFVLVMLDFPRKPENKAKISEALQKRNGELKTELGIRGFPSVLLMGSDGKPYARTGYQRGGVDSYLEHLNTLRADKEARDTLRATLKGVAGLERAKLLDELIGATPEDQHATLVDEMKEILVLDAGDEAGLKSKYAFKTRMMDVSEAQSAKEFEKAETMYVAIIEDLKPSGEQLQRLYFQWGEMKFRAKDEPGIVDCLTKALAAAPESNLAPQLKGMIKRFSPEEDPATEAAP
jgi:thioredoxin-related protein